MVIVKESEVREDESFCEIGMALVKKYFSVPRPRHVHVHSNLVELLQAWANFLPDKYERRVLAAHYASRRSRGSRDHVKVPTRVRRKLQL